MADRLMTLLKGGGVPPKPDPNPAPAPQRVQPTGPRPDLKQPVVAQRGKPYQDDEAGARQDAADLLTGQRTDWNQSMTQGGRQTNTRELSWDEYSALSPQQRATVDVNTALSNANKADAAARESGKTGDASYDKLVSGLFGENSGSKNYAPQTAALLSKLGLGNANGGNLDAYSGGSGLVTEDELKGITPESISQYTQLDRPAPKDRSQYALEVATQGQSALAAALSKGQSLLQAATGGTSAIGSKPGASDELDEMFNYLADRRNAGVVNNDSLASSLDYFKNTYGLQSTDISKYFTDKLAGAGYGNTPLSSDEGADSYSADEFRNLYIKNGG